MDDSSLKHSISVFVNATTNVLVQRQRFTYNWTVVVDNSQKSNDA